MMQPASPDPSPIYPEQDQMQTDNANEISSEHSEQPHIQISSPPREPIQEANELSPDKVGDENVVCRWDNCMSPFNSHASLAKHLSEVHIGWKRPDYYCEWDGCARRNIKSHSRFALLMHLRTHTGEKPYECTHPGCTQTFSRMDAMLKHKKSEHDEPRTSPVARVPSARGGKQGRKVVSSPVKHQRTEETHETKSKRKKIHDDRTLSTHRPNTAPRPISDDEAESTLSFQDKYRLAKAKLSYITQENEMLTDECNDLEKKLRRLRTERRILLDVLYRAEMGGDDDDDADKTEVAIDGEEEDDDDDIDDEEEL